MLLGGSGYTFRVLCWVRWLVCTAQVALCKVPSCILGELLQTLHIQVCQVPSLHPGAKSSRWLLMRSAACFMMLPLPQWQSARANRGPGFAFTHSCLA